VSRPEVRDRRLAAGLLAWFEKAARDLPWRARAGDQRPDAYRVLVSEIMLQQTQAARVAERFERFMSRFPTPAALAEADEQDVLAEWSGLGYYRRARLLHAAAGVIVERHGGAVPGDPAALRALPGVGVYTAGAVASLAFGLAEPAVDGNVVRVVLRLENDPRSQAGPETQQRVMDRVRLLLHASHDHGALNESLMELGATVCTPAAPRCDACPLADLCKARAAGTQEEIPPPKPRAKRRVLYAASLLATDADGRVLLRRRPATGLWADMWEPPTLERDDRHAKRGELAEHLGPALAAADLTDAGAFTHLTTHREVRFRVYAASIRDDETPDGCAWVENLDAVGLGSAQRRVLSFATGAVETRSPSGG